MRLADRLLAIHQALSAADLPHAFGGAIALAYWTEDPRGTSDIDVNIFIPAEDCERALEALPEGVAVPEGVAAQVVEQGQARLWWDRTPIDLFFNTVPIHEDAARHRRTVPFEGTEIQILGPVELAVFKAMFDRTKDWADIEAMIAANTLDLNALRVALLELLGPDDCRFARIDEAVRQVEAESA
ncbi:MAG: nucleotidyl transferase AbiEii/AbiGii toxin family protein [Solirubrobacterales bacterium]